MPCITVKTNVTLTADTELLLKRDVGQDIEIIPRKSEQWLMFILEDAQRLWLAGSDAPAVMVEVSLFGSAPPEAYASMTAALTAILGERLGIAPERIYVAYVETPHWGWNGRNL